MFANSTASTVLCGPTLILCPRYHAYFMRRCTRFPWEGTIDSGIEHVLAPNLYRRRPLRLRRYTPPTVWRTSPLIMTETFVVRDKVTSAKYTAKQLGYYLAFTPARSTSGRPSGGLALLCKRAQPLQHVEAGTHWEAGHCHFLPFESNFDARLYVFNVYGYSTDVERAQELNRSNRKQSLELSSAVAAGRLEFCQCRSWR
eukprot:4795343-Amphidinium_carterae.1